jgi:O-antigen ligase
MVFALLLAWQTLLPATVVERISMTETAGGQLESSAAERVELWDHAINLFRQHPIFGVGFGAFGYTRPAGSLTDTHNFYLRMLSEQGVIGVGLFLVVLAAAFRSGWRLYDAAHTPFSRGLGLGFMACVVAVMVTNVFGDRWSYFVLGSYFFIFWGLVDRGTFLARQQTAAERETQWQSGATTATLPGTADSATSAVTGLKHVASGTSNSPR